jgi:polyhydroxybutyrate depolymerase
MLNVMRPRPLACLILLALVVGVVWVPATTADAASSAKPSRGCGRAATPGSTTRHVTAGGTDREYLLSIPEGYDPSKPAPLIFDFHGLGSDMQQQALYSNLDVRGGARGYVVITPDGQGDVLRHWSLRPAAAANPDVAFVQAMLRTTNRELCIDPARVFSTGISNGAMFSTLLVCALPGRLAAIAPVSGVNATNVCRAGTPRASVLAFHGTADPIVPYEGGAYFSGAAAGRALGIPQAKKVDDAVAAWAAFDGCRANASTTPVAADVQHLVWPGCPGGRAVELYRIIGGGHTWPGGIPVAPGRLGATTESISATQLMLDFFDAHPRH